MSFKYKDPYKVHSNCKHFVKDGDRVLTLKAYCHENHISYRTIFGRIQRRNLTHLGVVEWDSIKDSHIFYMGAFKNGI